MSDERLDLVIQKMQLQADQNVELHEPFHWAELVELLDYAGDQWRQKIWSAIPTDPVFDSIYADVAERHRKPVFMYGNLLYIRDEDGSWGHPLEGKDVANWIEENPPFTECDHVAMLLEHSRGIEAGSNPWVLFQYIIGMAVTTQGMGLNSLMGVGEKDAYYLGKALEAWGSYPEIVEPYTELLIETGGWEAEL